jgi:aryl-alcohol dehydrogenase-like predicted oxidoreductase
MCAGRLHFVGFQIIVIARTGGIMRQVELGKTGIAISPIGLGCWQFSEAKGVAGKFWPALPEETIHEIVRISLAGGITWFDTAEIYGWGASERMLSSALKAAAVAPGDVVIATKWMPVLRRAVSIRKTFADRLDCLSPYPIDLHQVHFPASISSIEKQMNAMADLHDEGKIRAVGVSNFTRKQMEKAHDALGRRGIPLASNQMRYHLLNRKIESDGVLAAAKERGITIIAYSPLAQGLVTGKFHKDPGLIKRSAGPRKHLRMFKPVGLAESKPLIDELERVGNACNASAAEVALAWMIQRHGDTVVTIPGASKPQHAQMNVHALDLKLKQEEIERIDEISRKIPGVRAVAS